MTAPDCVTCGATGEHGGICPDCRGDELIRDAEGFIDYHHPDVIIPSLHDMRSVVADNAADLIARLAAEVARLTAELDAANEDAAQLYEALADWYVDPTLEPEDGDDADLTALAAHRARIEGAS